MQHHMPAYLWEERNGKDMLIEAVLTVFSQGNMLVKSFWLFMQFLGPSTIHNLIADTQNLKKKKTGSSLSKEKEIIIPGEHLMSMWNKESLEDFHLLYSYLLEDSGTLDLKSFWDLFSVWWSTCPSQTVKTTVWSLYMMMQKSPASFIFSFQLLLWDKVS